MKDYKKIRMIFGFAMAVILLAGQDSAASLIIDFRDPVWSSADRKSAYTVSYGDLAVTASAWKSNRHRTKAKKLGWWNDKGGADGLGIYGGENDEIDRNEYLRLDFNRTVVVSEFHLTDLFKTYGGKNDGDPFRGERAKVTLIHSGHEVNLGTFNGVDRYTVRNKKNGDLRVSLENHRQIRGRRADSIIFKAPYGKNNDFSVAEVAVSPTPEPGTLLLLGTGLIGLAGIRKKKGVPTSRRS